MEKKKKTWTAPMLTALVRRRPEEGILKVCKGGTAGPISKDGVFNYCADASKPGCIKSCKDEVAS